MHLININFKKVIAALLAFSFSAFVLCGCSIDEFLYDDSYITEAELGETELRVHYIDVGQGDCALVETKFGNILIDAGTPDSEDEIVEYVDSLGITEFEYAVFTHPHSDHIGSAAEIVERYTFNNIVLPDAVSTTKIYENLLDAIANEACDVILGEAGKSFSMGDVFVEIMAPGSNYDSDDLNNMSIVAKLTYGDVSFLFTGDAEKSSEKEILDMGYDVSADVLKVGHHGSYTSSCEDFLYAVYPSVAIISAGKDNEYGHPHDEVVERLEDLGSDMYITYEVGSIIVSTDGEYFSVSTENS